MAKKTLIFIILIILVLASLLIIIWWLIKQKKILNPKAQTLERNATLSLSPYSGSYKVGENFSVDILLDTQSAVVEKAEVKLKYDPQVLEVIDSDSALPGIQIKPGTIFPIYLSNSVKDDLISLVGFSSGAGFSGSGKFAFINFKPRKATLETKMSFVFEPGSFSDSNILERFSEKDILTTVSESKFNLIGS